MGTRTVMETRQDRRALVADAGFRRLSLSSVFAGVVTAYGLFALLAGIAVGVIKAANVDVNLASQWRDLGMAGGLVVAALLLVAYLFGGYVAGRMARRSGAMHGVIVFILGVALAVGAAALARQLGGSEVAADNLRDLGLPTTAAEWQDIATVAGIASLAAMLVGSLLGGVLGERWHAKLVMRAVNPDIGAEAEARRTAEKRAAEAEELRTGSFQRVRATAPSRARRVDREAQTVSMPVPRDKPQKWEGSRVDDDREDRTSSRALASRRDRRRARKSERERESEKTLTGRPTGQ